MTKEQIEALRRRLSGLRLPVRLGDEKPPDWRELEIPVINALARVLDEREVLVKALREIAASDHAEDGGPECDHAYIADKAIAYAEAP